VVEGPHVSEKWRGHNCATGQRRKRTSNAVLTRLSVTLVTEREHSYRRQTLDRWLFIQVTAAAGLGRHDRGATDELSIRRSAPMADATNRSWNHPGILTDGAFGLVIFEPSRFYLDWSLKINSRRADRKACCVGLTLRNSRAFSWRNSRKNLQAARG